jgi:hypothetical protein
MRQEYDYKSWDEGPINSLAIYSGFSLKGTRETTWLGFTAQIRTTNLLTTEVVPSVSLNSTQHATTVLSTHVKSWKAPVGVVSVDRWHYCRVNGPRWDTWEDDKLIMCSSHQQDKQFIPAWTVRGPGSSVLFPCVQRKERLCDVETVFDFAGSSWSVSYSWETGNLKQCFHYSTFIPVQNTLQIPSNLCYQNCLTFNDADGEGFIF